MKKLLAVLIIFLFWATSAGAIPPAPTGSGSGAPTNAHYLTDQAESGLSAEVVVSADGKSLVTAADYAAMKALLNLEIGTDIHAYDAELVALAGLTSAADKLPYFTGSGTASVADLTTYARSILDDANEATFKATVNLEIGTDVQAYDADLTTYAGITPSANIQSFLASADYATARTNLGLAIGTDVQAYDADLTTYAGITPSADVQGLLDDANYAAMRTSLGLAIGSDVQAYDADLTTYAGITPSADVQGLLDDANFAAMRTSLGLAIGSDVQAYDADLTTYAGITPSANVQSFLATADYAAMKTLMGYMTDLVDDTTPQLGGTLDFNSQTCTTFASTGIDDNADALAITLDASENMLFNIGSVGTNLAKGISWGSGTAASASVADAIQMWVADRGGTAGKASLHIRSEDGTSHVFGDRVGFGTTSPDVNLHLSSAVGAGSDVTARVESTNAANNFSTGISLKSTAQQYFFGMGNPANTTYAGKFFVYDNTGLASRWVINTSGYFSFGTETSPTQLIELNETETITGAKADGYAAALRLDPGYTAATAQTVTRHNYIDVQNVSVAGAGPAAVTNAAVFRFDAAIATHKAVVAGFNTTDSNSETTAWAAGILVNIDGTLYKIPVIAN